MAEFHQGDRVWVRPMSRSIRSDYGERFSAIVTFVSSDGVTAHVKAEVEAAEVIGVGTDVLEPRLAGGHRAE